MLPAPPAAGNTNRHLRGVERLFSILNVRSASNDLTTRARIRDAAIRAFGETGFTAGVRAIATAAGVSPGLVIHHFGSKDGLREACDTHVLDVIRSEKANFLQSPSAASMIAQLAEIEHYAPLIAYIVRSFHSGSALGRSLFEHMVDNTRDYLAAGVAAGTLRPSRDPAARARYATLQNLGGLLLHFQLNDTTDFAAALRDYSDTTTLAALELYTEGMLTDPGLLAGYVQTLSTPTEQVS